ncbi:MAG: sulfatase-like hydrolase/transferase, partial [Bryobacterales bacterium]|nr:sulfatase-like hydrolase/transferase [Bryobacterales bacterium]
AQFGVPFGKLVLWKKVRLACLAMARGASFRLSRWSNQNPWQAKQTVIDKYKNRLIPGDPQRNPMYAAMVEALDDAVGKLLEAVDKTGLRNDTIFVFFSDNGGVHWPLTKPGLMHPEFEQIPATSNAPLKGGKATLYEGGTREPCIVVWPGRTKPGSVSSELIQSIDFYPTLLQMAGLQPRSDVTLDGIDIRPALLGKRLSRDTLYCHFPHYTPLTGNTPGTWVRKGDWKLIRFYCENDDQSDKLELYNLQTDPGETNNLAAREPARVKELNSLITAFLERTKAAVPRPNPNFRRPA